MSEAALVIVLILWVLTIVALQLELSKHAEVSLANVMNSTVQSRKYHQEA
jgi:Na+/H+ antiporter NhaC